MNLFQNQVELEMDIPLILSCLPSLVAIDDVFVDDANLLIDPEFLRAMIVLHFSCNALDLLMELVDLLQLDQKDFVAHNAFDQVDKLLSGQDVQGD